MTGLLAGPSRRYSYPGMGFRVTVTWESTDSSPKGIPSDLTWPESRYYPFNRAAYPPRSDHVYILPKYKTPGSCFGVGWFPGVGFMPALKREAFSLHFSKRRGFLSGVGVS